MTTPNTFEADQPQQSISAPQKKGHLHKRNSDIRGDMTEWICEHGVGHHRGVHGCDGCCANRPEMAQTTEDETTTSQEKTNRIKSQGIKAFDESLEIAYQEAVITFPSHTSDWKKEQIKRIVNRFLGWKLPDDFNPDGGISFQPEHSAEYMAKQGLPPMKCEPHGTNLLNAVQAEAMIQYIVEDEMLQEAYERGRADMREEVKEEIDDAINAPNRTQVWNGDGRE